MALSSSSSLSSKRVIYVLALLMFMFIGSSSAQLSENFYVKTCPKALYAVKSVVQSAIAKEARMGGSLLRLFFHDCFVNVSYA